MLKNILNELERKNNIAVSHNLYENIREFKEKEQIHNMKSLMLLMSGLEPLYCYVFKEELAIKWFAEHNIKCTFDQVKQTMHLKKENHLYNSSLYK